MDLSLLPRNFKFASTSQFKFIKSATIEQLCERYSLYLTNYQNSTVIDASRDVLKNVLMILESKALVISYIEDESNLELYCLIDQLQSIKDRKKDDIKETRLDRTIPDEDRSNMEQLQLEHRRYVELIGSALRRNLQFDLPYDEFKELYYQENCFYTNVKMSRNGDTAQTFDRIDSSKGYVSGNVVSCSHDANRLKNELFESKNSMFKSLNDLKLFVDRISVSVNKTSLNDLLIA